MSSRPRRSCAKGDTSVLSPSTIFLWSDARLRQELTRRGLNRTGIRQDLIDRLLDSINGIKTDSQSSATDISSRSASAAQKRTPKTRLEKQDSASEDNVVSVTSETEVVSRKKSKRKAATPVNNSPSKQTQSKLSASQNETNSTTVPCGDSVHSRRKVMRASAGEDKTVSKTSAVPTTDDNRTTDMSADLRSYRESEESATEINLACSAMKPTVSILPKVRPLPSLNTTSKQSSTTIGSTMTTLSSETWDSTQGCSVNKIPSSVITSAEGPNVEIEPQGVISVQEVVRKSSDTGASTSSCGTVLSIRKTSVQKDNDERCSQRKASNACSSLKGDRLNLSKPITEAWAERFAELKKADPLKYSTVADAKEKTRERDEDLRRKTASSRNPPNPYAGNMKKSSVTVKSIPIKTDLLDSILSQQSQFLQTMRKSEERNSPEPSKVAAKVEQTEESADSTQLERASELSSAAEEAYRRFESTFAETNSTKDTLKCAQPLPPPPPPPKSVPGTSKKCFTGGSELSMLFVPPPPPPPPPHLPPIAKEIPPPPPPRRPRPAALEGLPPPPPPPKRLKPIRTFSAPVAGHHTVLHDVTPKGFDVSAEPNKQDNAASLSERDLQILSISSRAEDSAVMADVKASLEHVVFLVSSIKPFDEISGELLPTYEVPVPFSRVQQSTAPNLSDELVHEDEVSLTCKKEESSVAREVNEHISVQQVDEEYDPLDMSTVSDFEAYVPSSVDARVVALDERDLSIDDSSELPRFVENEPYSPPSHPAQRADDDDEDGEITEETDSDVHSIVDDTDEDSDVEEVESKGHFLLRQDDSGRFVKVLRDSRKRCNVITNICSQPRSEIEQCIENSTHVKAEVEISEEKPDPTLLSDPRHLLQRASAVLQDMRDKHGNQYKQMPYDDDFEEEECVQPMDSFHGEPVPDDDDLFEVAAGIKSKRKEEVIVEERVSECTEKFEIDFYNGDLHLKGAPDNDWVIDPDNQDGLALMWGGVKSTHGIFQSRRKGLDMSSDLCDESESQSFVFQIKITDLLPTRHLPFEELDPNDVRVGFSLRSAPLVLGEYAGSYCYTSLGKRATNNIFTDYGDSFGVGDVITAHMDFENCRISFWKNLDCLGTAFSNVVIPEDDALYPHICVKNCRVSVNFGTFPGGEKEWIRKPDWIFPNSLSSSRTERAPIPPESKSDCTVLMMVGLPSVGKTTWVRRYIREHPKEHWTLISADTILASMKVNGVSRNSSHIGRWDMVLGLVGKARNRLLSLAARRRRNYILDFTNCDPDTRKKRLALFEGFFRQCVTIVPSDEVMQQRHAKHLRQNRGEGTAAVPIETFLELKAVMEMPVVSEFLESVIYVDPAMEDAQIAIDRIAKFNEEGRPWYSTKYNKKRGFWNGTYGDDTYRKSSVSGARTQTSTEKAHSDVSVSVQSAPPPVQPELRLSIVDNPHISEKSTPPLANNSGNATVASNQPQVNPSYSLSKPNGSTPVLPVIFGQPPPPVTSSLGQPSNALFTTAPLSSMPIVNSLPVVSNVSSGLQPPMAVQIPKFSPRSRWDAPPPVLPNFTVPPPTLVTPPPLARPASYASNAVPVLPKVVPLIPNTSIPPPNVPPPGWP